MYKVRNKYLLNEEKWEVYTHTVTATIDGEEVDGYDDVFYEGTLSDCEAWIRLNESGYLN